MPAFIIHDDPFLMRRQETGSAGPSDTESSTIATSTTPPPVTSTTSTPISTSTPPPPPTSTTSSSIISTPPPVSNSVSSFISVSSSAASVSSGSLSSLTSSGAASSIASVSSRSALSTSSDPPTASSQSTIVVSTVFVTNGQTITSQVLTPTTIGVPNNSNKSSSNTGAIAGGVVGGVIGLAIFAALIWWFLRKKRQNEFDPDLFDPSKGLERPAAMPVVDVDLGGADAEPRPYDIASHTYTQNTATSPSHYTSSEGGLLAMSQHQNEGGAVSYNPRASTEPSEFSGGGGSSSGMGMSGQSARMTKQQEAARQFAARPGSSAPAAGPGGFAVTNPSDEDENVVVHQDGGRVQNEIPPTYDSIPADERGGRVQ